MTRKPTTLKKRRQLATAIKSARTGKGISQEELSRLSGRSLSYIQKIENCVRGNEVIAAQLIQVINTARKSA